MTHFPTIGMELAINCARSWHMRGFGLRPSIDNPRSPMQLWQLEGKNVKRTFHVLSLSNKSLVDNVASLLTLEKRVLQGDRTYNWTFLDLSGRSCSGWTILLGDHRRHRVSLLVSPGNGMSCISNCNERPINGVDSLALCHLFVLDWTCRCLTLQF